MNARGARRRTTRLGRQRPAPEVHWVRTRDGWRLRLLRYRASGADLHRSPVYLCHGLGSNRYDLDGPGEVSVARYLSRAGFDTWVVELRGCGASDRPRWYNRRRWDWTYDDYVFHDIPATLRHVEKVSGRRGVHWVGHSLGGTLGYSVLHTTDPGLVRSIVALGAPAMLPRSHPATSFIVPIRIALKVLPYVPQRWGRPLSPLAGRLKGLFHGPLMNAENMDGAVLKILAREALEHFPSTLAEQFWVWYRDETFASHYGTLSYGDRTIPCPVFLIAGAMDTQTPREDIRATYDQVSSPHRAIFEAGKAAGLEVDYGHLDLVLGRRAPDEIYPRIAEWLSGVDAQVG